MSKLICKLVVFIFMLTWMGGPAWSQGHQTGVLTILGTETGNATGWIAIVVNGQSQTVTFGQFSSAAAIASGFGAYFSQYPNPTAPPLCTAGICAKSDGAKIVFQFDNTITSQTVSWSSSANSPFSVDTSLWPQSGTGSQAPLPMTLNCTPSPVTVGDTTSCMAGLPAGTNGSVNFTVDGASCGTPVPLDPNGNAMIMGLLSGASLGAHIIGAEYSPTSGNPSAAYDNVQVQPNPGVPTAVYSYAITGYAANGNITGYTDSVNGTWTLGYDNLNRLVSSSQTLGALAQFGCWSYDSFGNRKIQAFAAQAPGVQCQPSNSTASYYANLMYFTDGSNQITGRGTEDQTGSVQPVAAPTYDPAGGGNITGDPTNQYGYTYDAQGHMCAAHTSGGMTGYLYDAAGHRVAKGTITSMSCDPTINGFVATNIFMLGSDGDTMTEVDGGTWARTHVSANGQQVATYDSTGVHFHIQDWLGTRRVQTNYAGILEDTCQSQPFGDGLNCTNNALDASDRHLTGKERDAESGLDYFGARYYASSMGRFMSPDWADKPEAVPYSDLSNPQSLNLYGYVNNNPLSHADADGHCDQNGQNCSVWDHVVGAVGGVLNLLPQSANFINSGGNAVLSTFTSYRIPMYDEIQPDAHASAGGMAVGQAAQILVPIGGEVGAGAKGVNLVKGAEEVGATSKVFSAEKQALVDMAKTDKKLGGMSKGDMEAYKELNKTLPDPFPANKVRGPESHSSGLPSSQQPHGHVGPVDHIPIKDQTP